MYQKKINKKEIVKRENEQKDLVLSNTLANTLYICKKDILCKKGIFMQGTPVFLDTDGKASIKNIYDPTQWNKFGHDYKVCFNDCCLDRITADNFSEYFEYDRELTLAYETTRRIANKLAMESNNYIDYLCNLEPLGFGLAVVILFVFFFMLLKATIAALVTIGFGAFLIGIIGKQFYYQRKRDLVLKEYKEYVELAKQDLKELAYRSENRAICYWAYANTKNET